jgi:cytosine/adenosine deaminase-related metal-dependent hydrolase
VDGPLSRRPGYPAVSPRATSTSRNALMAVRTVRGGTSRSTAACAAVAASLGTADVHTVIVDGRVVKRDGRLTELDLVQLRRSTADLARHTG